MFKERKSFITLVIFALMFLVMFLSIGGLLGLSSVEAANWQRMPTYNVLWPLWSPALSPGGNALVPDITKSTILPVQPGMVWDPAQLKPWAVYNTPAALGGGLLFFDAYGMNPWPPKYMVNPATGAPAPVPLATTWSLLLPTSLVEWEYYLPLANIAYALSYGLTGPAYLNLLTTAQIWGLPPV